MEWQPVLAADSDETISGLAPLGYFPDYLGNFQNFSANPSTISSVLAFTQNATPWTRPPSDISNNPAFRKTIASRPDLFKIVTPINVDIFEKFLIGHPNQPFVRSVCTGLREGFWPGALFDPAYPLTLDVSHHRPPQTAEEHRFLLEQRDEEVKLGRFSASFGPNLLPGMYSMPVHAVPKSSGSFRMITNHSVGKYSLNSILPSEATSDRTPFDTLKDLANALLAFRKAHGPVRLVLFKSDVKSAYRVIPMCFLWQLKQIVTFPNGERRVDRCNVFGSSASAAIWMSFMSLVMWIATMVYTLDNLFVYMDDSFSFELESKRTWYPRYKKYMPSKQVSLLNLWDSLGIPHEERKQLFGSTLTIVGFVVDANQLTISIDPAQKQELLDTISDFISPQKTSHSLREYQCLAGEINWSFNVFPLLRPGLSSIHRTIGGKSVASPIVLNDDIRADLKWLLEGLRKLPGTLHFGDRQWSESGATTVFVDACTAGIGIWIPHVNRGFIYNIRFSTSGGDIVFLESLAVVSALCLVHQFLRNVIPRTTISSILIHSDSTSSVSMFNSLSTSSPASNSLLKAAVDELISRSFALRVLHIPGEKNTIADALSRSQIEKARELAPGILISTLSELPCAVQAAISKFVNK